MKKLYTTLILFFLIGSAFAQKIPFQGRLLDGGRPFNGTATIEFSIASPTWSETKSNVPVTDGYYAVVLGETTPLPDTLFRNNREVLLNITVNSDALSPVTLYSPLAPFAGSTPLQVDTLRSLTVEVTGAKNEGKARLTTNSGEADPANDGYYGVMSLTDSLGRAGNFFRTRKSGGYLQLAQQDFTDDSFQSAALISTFGDKNSYMDLYGGNATSDGIQLMVDVYASNIDLNGPIADGYRRGGIDIRNYYNAFTHGLFSFQDGTVAKSAITLTTSEQGTKQKQTVELFSGDSVSGAFIEVRGKDLSKGNMYIAQDDAGSDPTGTSAFLDLWGNQSVNWQIASFPNEDNDLPAMNMYGSIDDGGGWWYVSGQLATARTGGGDEFGILTLVNNAPGISRNTANLTANLDESGAGGLELRNDAGLGSIILRGNTGEVSLNTDGANDEFMNIRPGGISAGADSFNDGFNLNYDATGGALLEMFSASNLNILLNGNSGDITALGNISGSTLTSSDGTVQTSDRRLKKNIYPLMHSLENTLKMRGVSYQWIDPTKSQRNQIGVIAQEVEAVYPEFVHTDDKGMKAVNYAQMTAVLIEAIRELNAKVESLEAENMELKASLQEVKILRSQMDHLMKALGSSKAASK